MKKIIFILILSQYSRLLAKLAFLAAILNTQYSFSQPSLDSSYFPLAGVSYNRFVCVGGTVGNAGANQQYDFSNSLIWVNDTMRYISPQATGFAANHPGASVATVQWGDITIIWYYSADANAFWTSGGTLIGDLGAGFTITHANHPAPYVDTLISNEYTYGHSETEISGIRFQNIYPGIDYQTVSGKYIVCDGYGTLYAPLDTFQNVLRVKYIEFKFDTAFFNGVPDTAGATTDTLYYYKYFVQGFRHPVLIANTNEFDEIQWIEALVIPDTMFGCTDANAENFNPLANGDDGTCIYCNQLFYSITPDKTVCEGDTVSLSASGATDYFWSTGDSVSAISVIADSSQTISVLLSNQSYCWQIANVNIYVYEDVLAEFWATEIQGDSILFVNTSENATDYFWDFGDLTTSTEKNPRHLYLSEGTKTVMLIASNQCSSDTFNFDLTIVGEKEFWIQNPEFQIYPNPSDGKFVVKITNQSRIRWTDYQLQITNLIGEVMFSKQLTTNNEQLTTNLPTGIYFVQIKSGEKFYQQKIIKL